MAKYLVEAPHTPEQCLTALDQVVTTKPELLNEFQWGCMGGVHNGWAVLEADSESAARNLLPDSIREQGSVTEVTQFTPEQIEAYKTGH